MPADYNKEKFLEYRNVFIVLIN